eukprot:3528589-Rhodomonas_salina.1
MIPTKYISRPDTCCPDSPTTANEHHPPSSSWNAEAPGAAGQEEKGGEDGRRWGESRRKGEEVAIQDRERGEGTRCGKKETRERGGMQRGARKKREESKQERMKEPTNKQTIQGGKESTEADLALYEGAGAYQVVLPQPAMASQLLNSPGGRRQRRLVRPRPRTHTHTHGERGRGAQPETDTASGREREGGRERESRRH